MDAQRTRGGGRSRAQTFQADAARSDARAAATTLLRVLQLLGAFLREVEQKKLKRRPTAADLKEAQEHWVE